MIELLWNLGSDLAEFFRARFDPLRDTVDILLVTAGIYWLLLLIRGTRAVQILVGLIVLIALSLASELFQLAALGMILERFLDFAVLIIVILFQNDIRRALARVGRGFFPSFAEERDINVLMAYGRCLRPALYSSLRSSPSHPTGVSALRVTIAIANVRFARKQWGLRKSTAKSRPPADVFGHALIAFCRKSPRVPRVCWLGRWALGISDGGRQGKSAASGRAHVVGGVEVLRGDESGHAAAARRNVREINASSAVGLSNFAVRQHETARQ